MKDVPSVCSGDVLRLGSTFPRKKFVVCNVYPEKNPLEIEVVYLDTQDRAINEDMVWNGDNWEFKCTAPCGGYADNLARLAGFVSQLKS
jgi:hypothetical protein